MAFLQDIRTRIGEYFLKKESVDIKRSKSIINLKDAKTIGILYNAGADINDIELIKKYITYLRDSGKKGRSMGYAAMKRASGQC